MKPFDATVRNLNKHIPKACVTVLPYDEHLGTNNLLSSCNWSLERLVKDSYCFSFSSDDLIVFNNVCWAECDIWFRNEHISCAVEKLVSL